MNSVLLVINMSAIKEEEELQYHPIVMEYKKAGFSHPIAKIDKFGENALTLLYNLVISLAEPERIARNEYYDKKRKEREEERERQKELAALQPPPQKEQEKKKPKCLVF